MRLLIAMTLVLLSWGSHASPEAGDPAPAFTMQGSDGNTWNNENLAGQGYVIAFFPKAFTGG